MKPVVYLSKTKISSCGRKALNKNGGANWTREGKLAIVLESHHPILPLASLLPPKSVCPDLLESP